MNPKKNYGKRKLLTGIFSMMILVVMIMMLAPFIARAESPHDVYWKIDGTTLLLRNAPDGEGWTCYSEEDQKKVDAGADMSGTYPGWIEIDAYDYIEKVQIQNKLKPVSMRWWFVYFMKLTAIEGLDLIDTSDTEGMYGLFNGCELLTSLDLHTWDTSKVKIMEGLFESCTGLTSINLKGWNTKNVQTMENMFHDCPKLKEIDVSHFDTGNVSVMSGMFWECTALEQIDVSHFDTSQVTDMEGMFHTCSSLKSLDISGFDTSQVTLMDNMFKNCSSLKNLDVSGFDTRNVKEIFQMFQGCTNLESLDLSGFDFGANEEGHGIMLGNRGLKGLCQSCENLKSINLGKADLSKLSDISYMFDGCANLKKIETVCTADWSSLGIPDEGLFDGCVKLAGEKGTVYDSTKTGLDYARVDGGKDAPGYFTAQSHNWGEPEYTWSEDKLSVTAVAVCKDVASHKEEETVQAKKEEIPASCTEAGSVTYTAEFANALFQTQIKTETLDALGHEWSEWEEKDDKLVRICSRCGEEEEKANETAPTGEDTSDLEGFLGEDGTALGRGASAASAEAAILSMTSDADPVGSRFAPLRLKSTKQTKKSVTIRWKKISGTAKYVIYGNKCGRKNKMKKLAMTTGTKKTFKKILGKKVKKGTYYKFLVVAIDKDDKVISASKLAHAATKGGKRGNVKKITTKAKKSKVSLKAGKTFKLKAKAVPVSKKKKVKKHRGMRYESTNPDVASVTKNGVIKASAPGECDVYAYAQNGVHKKIRVKVK